MTINSTSWIFADAVPEGDRAEQATLAYPDDPAYGDAGIGADTPMPTATGGGWAADPVDVLEQSIPVPLGEDDHSAETGS